MAKQSSRSARRKEHQSRRQRQRILTIVLGVAGILIIVGGIFWVREITDPSKSITLPESLTPPPNADGSAWGPADAPVLIEEYSDFQ